jgi:MFS family permease
MRYYYLSILALSGFVTSFGAHIVATNLPTYAEATGAGALMIGLLIGIYDLAELFAKPFAGFVADQRGMKGTLLVGLGVFIFGSFLFLVVSPHLLVVVRFVQGLGAAALSTVSISLVAKHFAQGRGQAFGIYNAIKGAGYVISPALGGYIVQVANFAMIFVVSGVIGVIAMLLSLFLPRDRARGAGLEEDAEEITLAQFFSIFKERRLLPVYAVIFINMFLVSILFGFLPFYLHSIGYTAVQSGGLLSVATVSYLLVQPLAGHLADRFEIRVTVVVGLLLAATGIVVATFTSGVALIAVVIAAGVGIGTVWTNSDTLVSLIAHQRSLGASIGAAQSFKEMGDMVGPLVVGALTQAFGVRAGFVSCGILALALLVLLVKSRALPADRTCSTVK